MVRKRRDRKGREWGEEGGEEGHEVFRITGKQSGGSEK